MPGTPLRIPTTKDGYRVDDAADASGSGLRISSQHVEEVVQNYYERGREISFTASIPVGGEFPLARSYYSGYYAAILRRLRWNVLLYEFMNIGETIRNFRLEKGMSQGDIEKRTGLLRCYLSRVENGHTVPSLDTLAKIAGAMELPLSHFFAESGHTNGSKGLPQLSDDEVRFLSQIRRYAVSLNDSDRKLVLAMVKKMAASAGK
jgi:transcriptional regulator with XRE-family HTH domain